MHLLSNLGIDLDPLGRVVMRVRLEECAGDPRHFDTAAESTSGQACVLCTTWPVKRQAVVVSATLYVYQRVGPVDYGWPEDPAVVDYLRLGLDSDVLPEAAHCLQNFFAETCHRNEPVLEPDPV